MHIWRIYPDYNYQALTLAEEIENLSDLLLTKSAATWKPFRVRFDPRATGGASDFPIFFSEMVWSQSAIDALRPLVNDKIEALPLIFDEGDYYIINVLNILSCFDESLSQHYRNERGLFRKTYFFSAVCIENEHIFQLHRDSTPAYVSDKFKSFVEELGLTGFTFQTFDYHIV